VTGSAVSGSPVDRRGTRPNSYPMKPGAGLMALGRASHVSSAVKIVDLADTMFVARAASATSISFPASSVETG
jgi:hypothetical protein